MMNEVVLLAAGLIAGVLVHSVTMKVSFKQRTIDNKIKVYDALIAQWVKMRNFVIHQHPGQPTGNVSEVITQQFDKIYGESQLYVGETFLVCEDVALVTDINTFNEKVYRTDWCNLSRDQVNSKMEEIKHEAIVIISRMREDIKVSTRFELRDFVHMFLGFRKSKKIA